MQVIPKYALHLTAKKTGHVVNNCTPTVRSTADVGGLHKVRFARSGLLPSTYRRAVISV